MKCAACGHDNRESARFCDECGAQLEAPTSAAEMPARLGGDRYVVDRFLGEGARKRVYLAHDTRLDRAVAVAVIKADGLDDAGRLRIDREARATARLGDHPHIVTVFDVFEDTGGPQIVSQYMAGGTLAERLGGDGAQLPIEDALQITEQLGLALQHAHDLGIVHRDVKPANVWFAADGTVRLGDFGLAAAADESRLTAQGMIVGTVAYLAPEQATGRSPDARSDIYALGAVLYEMLTGRPPFLGDDAVGVISQHLNTSPVLPSWHNAEVSRALDDLVLRMLAKDPARRPESAGVLVEEVRRIRESSMDPAVPAVVPPTEIGGDWRRFVGREDELSALRAACDAAIAGESRLVMVVGEPGIGKTRLVEEAAAYAAVRGAATCWGHCYEGEVGVPYLPFVEALRAYVRTRPDEELRSELGTAAPEIATLVSELRQRFPDLPESPPLDGDAERLRMFDGVSTFLSSASRAQPIMVVLDDLHWADKPSLLMLQYLARNLSRDRVLIVGTYRDVDLDRAHPLADTVAVMRRERLYERLLLRGMPRDDVKAFIEAVGEQETPDAFADMIFRATEGNPFFVAEILRHLAETGGLQRVDGRWVGTPESIAEHLPEGVREVIGRRLDRLGEACNRMLSVAAAMPGGFTPEVVAAVAGEGEDTMLDLLDEALAAQVVRERRAATGTYEFTHALIRQTLYNELSTPRRVRLHRQIAEALESLPAGKSEAQLPELAYHWFQAAPGGAIDKAVDYAVRAGDRARDAAAHEEAARFYDQALQALDLDDSVDDRQRAELLLAKGGVLHRAGETDAGDAALDDAAELARRLGDGEMLGRVALAATATRWAGGFDDRRNALVEEALAAVGPEQPALRARLLSSLASYLVFHDLDRHFRLSAEAEQLARESRDPVAITWALYLRAWQLRDEVSDDIDTTHDEMAALADETGSLDLGLTVRGSMLQRALVKGDRAAVESNAAVFESLAIQSRSPFRLAAVANHRAVLAVIDGRYDDAETFGAEMLEYGRRLRDPSMIGNFGILMFPAWREQGRAASLEGPTRGAVNRTPVPAWRAGLAQTLLWVGKLEEARAELDVLAQDFRSIPDDPGRRYALCASAEVAAALGDTDRALLLYDVLLSHAGLGVVVGPFAYHGVADRYLGLLALSLDVPDDAIRHLEIAVGVHDNFGARPWAARTRYDLARALLARGGETDESRALVLLNEALDTAQEVGMPVLVDDVLPIKLELQGLGSGSSPDASIDAVALSVSHERPNLRRHASPDGRVAVVFSDIEDYTPLTERLGDARSQEVLRAHNEILRATLAAHHGTEVKSHGDGFMLAFEDPVAAVRFGLEYQRSLTTHDFGDGVGDLRAHVGVHLGEVIREGDDFFGRTVILAARIASAAAGGEVLVSDELRKSVGNAIKFGDGRKIELKGLTGLHGVFPAST